VERAGGHRALRCRHRGREEGANPGAPAPADGEGTHVEVVARAQGAQRAQAEDADAGGRPQERRGIKCHREACRHGGPTTHQLDALGTGGALHMAQAVIAPSTERIDPVA
jgi:hypothetical protein